MGLLTGEGASRHAGVRPRSSVLQLLLLALLFAFFLAMVELFAAKADTRQQSGRARVVSVRLMAQRPEELHTDSDDSQSVYSWPQEIPASLPALYQQQSLLQAQKDRGIRRVLSVASTSERLFNVYTALTRLADLGRVLNASVLQPFLYRNAIRPQGFEMDAYGAVPINTFVQLSSFGDLLTWPEWNATVHLQRKSQLHVLVLEQCEGARHNRSGTWGILTPNVRDHIIQCVRDPGQSWPKEKPALTFLVSRENPHAFDVVVLIAGERGHNEVHDLLGWLFLELEPLVLNRAACPTAANSRLHSPCSIHIALSGKYYKDLHGFQRYIPLERPGIAVAPEIKKLVSSMTWNSSSIDLRQCHALAWRAVRFSTSLEQAERVLADIQGRLHELRATCVLVVTDFTVFKEPGGGLTCADIHDAAGKHCVFFEKWRPVFLRGLAAFRPVVLAQLTDPLLRHTRELHTDPETMGAFLDLAGLSLVRHVLNYGGHFFILAKQLEPQLDSEVRFQLN